MSEPVRLWRLRDACHDCDSPWVSGFIGPRTRGAEYLALPRAEFEAMVGCALVLDALYRTHDAEREQHKIAPLSVWRDLEQLARDNLAKITLPPPPPPQPEV